MSEAAVSSPQRWAEAPAPDVIGELGSLPSLAPAAELMHPASETPARPAASDDEPRFNCEICMDDVPLFQGSQLRCGHLYCASCVRMHVKTKIESGGACFLHCPRLHCGYSFTQDEVRRTVSRALFSKYQRFLHNAAVSTDRHSRWCSTPDCETVLQRTSKSNRLDCPTCGGATCFACKDPWHPGRTCPEKENSEWVHGSSVKKCPRCSSSIEKSEGCNHMTCTLCGYEFCWLCDRQYSTNHFSPYNLLGCPGLQSGRFSERSWPAWKRFLWKILIVVVILTFLAIGLGVVALSLPCIGIYCLLSAVDYTRSFLVLRIRRWFAHLRRFHQKLTAGQYLAGPDPKGGAV